jgi:hypothetical protein
MEVKLVCKDSKEANDGGADARAGTLIEEKQRIKQVIYT